MLVTVDDIRNESRVETAVPDAIIERSITLVDTVFRNYLQNTYTDVVDDPDSNPTLADVFHTTQLYLVLSRLLGDRFVVTGFGLVKKDDEYSTAVSEEEYYNRARQYVKDASTILNLNLGTEHTTDIITDCSQVTETFFTKKKDNSQLYNPYNRIIIR